MQATMDIIKIMMGFKNCFAVNPLGQREGLTLLWKYEDQAELVNYSHYHIHMNIKAP